MKNTDTLYRLAEEYEIPLLLKRYNITDRLGWPTVVAERDGQIIGFFSTEDNKNCIVAGPIVADTSIVGMRLSEAYDNLLRHMGIKEYFIYIWQDNPWLRTVQKRPEIWEPVQLNGDQGNRVWFKRRI